VPPQYSFGDPECSILFVGARSCLAGSRTPPGLYCVYHVSLLPPGESVVGLHVTFKSRGQIGMYPRFRFLTIVTY